MMIWGPTAVGKSYFALTCPEPVYVISTEFGVAKLYKHFPGRDIKVLECAEPYTDPIKKQGVEDTDPFSVDPVKSLEKVEAATEALKDIQKGTIVVDVVSDIWEWMGTWLKANAKLHQSAGGTEYMMRTDWQDANARYKWLIMRLLSRPCHVVLTARSQGVYDDKGNMTTKTKAAAQKNTEYWVDFVASITLGSGDKVGPDGKVIRGKPVRTANITKCRFNGDLIGETITDITFDSMKETIGDQVPDEVFS